MPKPGHSTGETERRTECETGEGEGTEAAACVESSSDKEDYACICNETCMKFECGEKLLHT